MWQKIQAKICIQSTSAIVSYWFRFYYKLKSISSYYKLCNGLFCRHTAKNLHHCTACNKVFLKPSRLKSHFRKHERDQRNAGKSFECYLCKFQFLRTQGLRIHINVKHVASLKNHLQCEHCNGLTFTHQMAFDDHLRSEHQLSIPLKCPHCNMKFQEDQSAAFKEHLDTHSEQNKLFMCEVGRKCFLFLDKSVD